MSADVTRLDLANRWRSLAGYSLGMAVYTLVVVALYPAFRDSTSLDDFITSDATAAALFGVTGSLTSPDGWLNGNIYANFLPLVMLLLTIGYGAAALAGQDEDGTLCLVAVLPLRRRTIVAGKATAMIMQALVLAATVGLCVLVGRWFDLTIAGGHVAAVSVSIALLGVDLGLVAMAVGALTGRRSAALGVATAAAAASYLVSSLAPVVSWLDPVKYVSLFYWSVGDNQLGLGVSLADYAVLVAAGAAALYVTIVAFGRVDLHLIGSRAATRGAHDADLPRHDAYSSRRRPLTGCRPSPCGECKECVMDRVPPGGLREGSANSVTSKRDKKEETACPNARSQR
jgi:beta-exotoxin I transport system permease protein